MFNLTEIYDRRDEFIRAVKENDPCEDEFKRLIAAKEDRKEFMAVVLKNIDWCERNKLLDCMHTISKHGVVVITKVKQPRLDSCSIFKECGDQIIDGYESVDIVSEYCFAGKKNNKVALYDYRNWRISENFEKCRFDKNHKDSFVYMIRNHVYCIYNREAKFILQTRKEAILSKTDIYIAVKSNTDTRIVDINGTIRFISRDKDIDSIGFHHDMAYIRTGGKYSAWDLDNQEFIFRHVECDSIHFHRNHNVAKIEVNGLTGIMDTANNWLLKPSNISILRVDHYRIIFKNLKTNKYGLMNIRCECLVPATTYDHISWFKNGYFVTKIGQNTGLIDMDGNVIEEAVYWKVDNVDSNGDYTVYTATKKSNPTLSW